MEIFNVNRQAYQHLGVLPWTSKPAPNTVPIGTRFTSSTERYSDWWSNGLSWLPVDGSQVVHAPTLVSATAQSASLALVASVPGWTMPSDMASIPGLHVDVEAIATFTNPSAAQARSIRVGTGSTGPFVIYGTLIIGATQLLVLRGRGHRRSDSTDFVRPGYNEQLMSSSVFDTVSAANLTSGPISLWYQGGNSDGSEIATFHSFSISVGIGT